MEHMMTQIDRRQALIGLGVGAMSGVARADEAIRITFVLVNDIYQMNEVDGRGGLPRLASVVKAERARSPNVVFAHAGDTISPSLMSGFDQGAHMIELFNALPPDVFAPGNHEFDFGSEVYIKRMGEAKFPVLAANLRNGDGSILPGHRDTMMIERGGVKIGVVGATLETTGLLSSPGPLRFAPTVETIVAAARKLKSDGADITVAVVHADKLTGQKLMAARAADIILSGHNHDLHIDFDGKTSLTESGEDADYVVAVDVAVTIAGEGADRKISWWPNYRVFDTKDVAPDPAMAALVKTYEDELQGELGVAIARVGAPLDSTNPVVRGGEAAIGNFIADALRARSGADVAMVNGGGIRGNRKYPAGYALTRRDVLVELPFGNRLATTRVTGRALREAIEHGIGSVGQLAGRFPQVSGLEIIADGSAPRGHRVVSIKVGGAPLDDARVYVVATNDFMLRGGDGYASLADPGATVDSGDSMIANEVMVYAREMGTIDARVEGRIVIK
jgi:5'-nucleotidase/UDP-sugar diphosphatase